MKAYVLIATFFVPCQNTRLVGVYSTKENAKAKANELAKKFGRDVDIWEIEERLVE